MSHLQNTYFNQVDLDLMRDYRTDLTLIFFDNLTRVNKNEVSKTYT